MSVSGVVRFEWARVQRYRKGRAPRPVPLIELVDNPHIFSIGLKLYSSIVAQAKARFSAAAQLDTKRWGPFVPLIYFSSSPSSTLLSLPRLLYIPISFHSLRSKPSYSSYGV